MVNSKNSNPKQQSALLQDTQLDAAVGGGPNLPLSPPLALAAHQVGGWTMRDIWTRPTLGTYH